MVLQGAVDLLTSDILVTLVFEIIFLSIMGLFIWIGAWFAQITGRSFLKAFVSALIITIISYFLIIPFSSMFIIALLLSLFVNIAVIKVVFSASWRKSSITWVFSIIAQVLVLGALVLVALFL